MFLKKEKTYFRILLLLLLWSTTPAIAQDNTSKKDTTKQDNKIYKEIETYSDKSKFTKLLHKLLFRPVKEQEASNNRKQTKKQTPEMLSNYKEYEGKVIRHIKIETFDPFGYSVSDTARRPKKWIERMGNIAHIKTRQFTIRNLLLIKKNKRLDSLLVKESERLIRAQRYARAVMIKPVAIPNSKDSVDIYVRVLDSWSLNPNGSASGSGTTIEITERNFLGLGHLYRNEFDNRFSTGETSYATQYKIPNIANTYIDFDINYAMLQSENSLKSVGLERPFFSPYTRWAGGAYLEERLVRDSLPDAENNWALENQKTEVQDYWGGYSFRIVKGQVRTTKLVTTARFFRRKYKEAPSEPYDPIDYYSNEKLYLSSIGVMSRGFVQDKFLFNHDVIEDIPIGRTYSGTIGIQDKNSKHRLYLGGRYALGNYHKWGYLSLDTKVGAFFHRNKTKETVLRFDMLYFTNIKKWGKWKFRHFVKPSLVFGNNRKPIITDLLNINDENGIQGFNSRNLYGTKKFLLTVQTQSYSPWEVLGFRFNPFTNFTMGIIGDDVHRLFESKVYTKFGAGVLIYNDYLVFNSFQLSIAFYPTIPGQGHNIFKTNTFKNKDITLPDFQINKPIITPYE
ncbi:hypothetical protein [uncultured Flavobacterium sp.]|uniref:hypothetical protein n=1 Tax=uncultured Flavobacterium sp. TaxID=165435 RepID=UPI000AA36979|nr:hypothetical protein [uncultured Flavobacterium sp.]